MFSLLHTLFFFIAALAILIVFHEFGHFWAARRLGVKVLRFSVGFGKPLWRYRKTPDSTEFVVAALPLGGYVKMVDEREEAVAPADLPYAFNRQPLIRRAGIVFAGPFFNFVLAVLIYWVVFMLGETGIRPVLGPVAPGTLAAQAGFAEGDEILAVDGEKTPTWNYAMGELFERVMDEKPVPVTVAGPGGARRELSVIIPPEVARQPDLLYKNLGLRPFEPELPPVLGHIEPGSAAQAAGLLNGDRIILADGTSIKTWRQWVDFVKAHAEKDISLIIERNGARMDVTLKPRGVDGPEGRIGRIGAMVQFPEDVAESMRVVHRLGFFPAFAAALDKTTEYSGLTLKMIGRMLIGKAGLENLSGPISIAQYAGQSAKIGLDQFLKFLAIVSISLAVLNLLPIPVLDGGHLMFYLIEAIKGSPVSDQTQAMFQQVGMFILLCLMGLAFVLDIERLLA